MSATDTIWSRSINPKYTTKKHWFKLYIAVKLPRTRLSDNKHGIFTVSTPNTHVVSLPGVLRPTVRDHLTRIVDRRRRLRVAFVVRERRVDVLPAKPVTVEVVVVVIVPLAPHPHIVLSPCVPLPAWRGFVLEKVPRQLALSFAPHVHVRLCPVSPLLRPCQMRVAGVTLQPTLTCHVCTDDSNADAVRTKKRRSRAVAFCPLFMFFATSWKRGLIQSYRVLYTIYMYTVSWLRDEVNDDYDDDANAPLPRLHWHVSPVNFALAKTVEHAQCHFLNASSARCLDAFGCHDNRFRSCAQLMAQPEYITSQAAESSASSGEHTHT